MTTLLSNVARLLDDAPWRGGDVEVHDVVHDSRGARRGALFAAIPGSVTDGHDHAADAVARGACALLVERWLDLDVPQIVVESVRAATGPAAALVHGEPSRELTIVGVTGTNGKTTIATFLEAAFAADARGTGVIGTVSTRIHGARQPGVRTTPEGTDLQRLLRSMHTRGVDAVAMEVSSHGLDLHRVDGVHFAVAAYSNLSQDHLDWHGSMEAYYLAKRRLFIDEFADRAVVFLDGVWGRRLAGESGTPVTTVGWSSDADLRILEAVFDIDGARGRLKGTSPSFGPVDVPISTTLPGRFNLANAASAVAAATAAGVGADVAAAGVAASPGVPGRLERVDVGGSVHAFVDYAHTPDAIEQVIAVFREVADPSARVIIVLGCGGERDTGKRGLMGAAATAADVAVLTSDNPRSEDPAAILAAVEEGARRALASAGSQKHPGHQAPSRAGGAQLVVEPDRRAAIAVALNEARAGDVVVVAGKGHETEQILAEGPVPFDDREVLREESRHGERQRR